MFLSRPSPTFATLALKSGGQAAKESILVYCSQERSQDRVQARTDKRYKRMGAKGVVGSYNSRPTPWEV